MEQRDSGKQPATAQVPPQVGQYAVFLSYSRADQKFAKHIVSVLENAGHSVWWDGLLEGGDRYAATTQTALDNAHAVVVLWSKTSVDSHWVHDEAMRGRDSGRLVPVSIDGSEPPLGFGQFQWIDASRDWANRKSQSMQKLQRAVAALHEREPQLDVREAPTGLLHNRRAILVGGGVALAAVGGRRLVEIRLVVGGIS